MSGLEALPLIRREEESQIQKESTAAAKGVTAYNGTRYTVVAFRNIAYGCVDGSLDCFFNVSQIRFHIQPVALKWLGRRCWSKRTSKASPDF